MPHKDNLNITDICLLRVMIDHPEATRRELWAPRGKGLWNRFLRESGLIRLGRCTFVTAYDNYNDAISTLRFCGLLTERERYEVSDAGRNLFLMLSVKVRLWPLSVKLDEQGNRLWETAIYWAKK